MLCCSECGKGFSKRSNLYRHERDEHNHPTKSPFSCDECEFLCYNKKILIQHLRINHGFFQNKKNRLKCTLCDVRSSSYKLLDEHVASIHDFQIEEELYLFENETEFQTWKSSIQKESKTQYRAERGLRKYKTHTQREYVCHCSYEPVLKNTDRKRALRSLGTNKISAACPSRMNVKFMNKYIEVKFIRCHVGHSVEVIRTSLTAEQPISKIDELKSKYRVLIGLTNGNMTEENVNYISMKLDELLAYYRTNTNSRNKKENPNKKIIPQREQCRWNPQHLEKKRKIRKTPALLPIPSNTEKVNCLMALSGAEVENIHTESDHLYGAVRKQKKK